MVRENIVLCVPVYVVRTRASHTKNDSNIKLYYFIVTD